jgi:hydroxyacylglutathione hydrolase
MKRPEVTAEELDKLIKNRQAPIILDVRTLFEFNSGHIVGAIHAPVTKILAVVAEVVKNKDDLLLLTCEHGPRALLGKTFLKWRGYKNVELLAGHMLNWRNKGLTTQRHP